MAVDIDADCGPRFHFNGQKLRFALIFPPLPDNAKALLPDAGFYLLVASEAAAALLGYMLFDNYNGRLSTTGFVMAAAMLLHLLLNVLLHLSGVNIAADLAVGAANIAYFCLLKNRFLTHEEYVRKVRGKKA